MKASEMKCCKCGRGIFDGVALHRQNENADAHGEAAEKQRYDESNRHASDKEQAADGADREPDQRRSRRGAPANRKSVYAQEVDNKLFLDVFLGGPRAGACQLDPAKKQKTKQDRGETEPIEDGR